jgi:hypothetical protein
VSCATVPVGFLNQQIDDIVIYQMSKENHRVAVWWKLHTGANMLVEGD